MMLFKRVLSGATLLLAMAGCGKGELVTQAQDMQAEMCACKDLDCAKTVYDKLVKFETQHKREKVTKSENRAIQEAAKKAAECEKSLRLAAEAQPTPATDLAPTPKPAATTTTSTPDAPAGGTKEAPKKATAPE